MALTFNSRDNTTLWEILMVRLILDQRICTCTDAFFILMALVLTTFFISYSFTWREAPDTVFSALSSIIFDSEVTVADLLRRLGAYVSHLFVYQGFGVGS